MQCVKVSRLAAAVSAILIFGSASTQATPAIETPQWPSSGLCQRLADPVLPGVDAEDREAVAKFYADRECRPLWIEGNKLTSAAQRVVAEFAKADEWGLDAADFRLTRTAQVGLGAADTSPAAIADADFEITGAVLRYARYARGGRISDPATQLSSYLDRRPELPDPAAVLAEISVNTEPDTLLRGYHPRHEQFLRLKSVLAGMRAQQTEAETSSIPAAGPEMRVGVRHADIVAVKKRLGVTDSDGDLYTPELADAVKAFQRQRGLRADAIIGKGTRKAFAANETRGTAAIIANMEAWRWMPRDLGAKHIFVNIPSYSIVLYDHGQAKFSERVIVGERETQTPVFSMAMQTVVLRPEWYMPDSIKLKKLLGGRSLESQGYVIKKNGKRIDSSRIDWSKANLSAYTVSQPAGDDNALGAVKFLFPNKHTVYMHDTPKKSLFEASERTFSHGCVRVRNPLQLARILLDDDKGPGKIDVTSLVRKGPHQNEITLDTKVPVHIGYFTVWVGEDGTPFQLKDTYGHEKRITLALAKQWAKIDKGRNHLAAVDTSQLRGLGQRLQPGELPPPMGVTSIFGGWKYQTRKTGDSVSDIINRAIGF